MLQAETLVDHIKFDHGYTAKSPAIVNVCRKLRHLKISNISLSCSGIYVGSLFLSFLFIFFLVA